MVERFGLTLRPALSAALALLGGALLVAAFAPLELWGLQPLLMAGLYALNRHARPGQVLLQGWLFGLGWLSVGLWWLYISLNTYGHLPPALAAGGVLLLCAGLALYVALALGFWARWLRREGGPGVAVLNALSWSAMMLLADVARGTWLTGFPWIAQGYAHTTGLFAGLPLWLGTYGTGFAATLSGVALVELVLARAALQRLAWAGTAALPVLLSLTLPQAWTTPTGALRVRLFQTAIDPLVKFQPAEISQALTWHQRIVREALGAPQGQSPQLLLTPETSVPLIASQLDASWWQALAQPLRERDGVGGEPRHALLLGVFTGDEARGYTNTAVAVTAQWPDSAGSASLAVSPFQGSAPLGVDAPGDSSGGPYLYGKRHLLPFGEFVPPGFHWFVSLLGIPMSDQTPAKSAPVLRVAGQRVRPLICYEDLFAQDVSDSVRGTPDDATVLVNQSNLAWFGPRLIQAQHLQFSRMRALEFQRPLVRATNTGATAAVDERGHVTAALPPDQPGQLDVTVTGRTGLTPYARWLAAWGHAPLVLLALALVLAAGLRRRTL
ncbi:apolipoprotein N-acyltransferase [Amphibiibacter pelophylacis]|uniref:Apolipoprotein N-acyltransferase n=1 Tax=Amphibiibacter pelophylacis TaxID=1799477 RepID=A0ACC6P5A0_9BURK